MEHLVYHYSHSPEDGVFVVGPPPISPEKIKPGGAKVAKILLRISRLFAYVGVVLLLIAYLPSIFFWLQGLSFGANDNFKLTEAEVETLAKDVKILENYSPAFDPKLPKDNHLTIKAIGVNTTVQEATLDNYEVALKKGVWRVSDFGAPGETGVPVILAAHRYGYLAWTNSFRRLNSFFNLPKLNVGDLVEISWHQRKYTYAIYGEDKGEHITDYSADLILYTCETLNGPVRIFKYAKLLKI